jgi:hypothetical protein
MPNGADPAWAGRLRDVLGAPLHEVRREQIEALVTSRVKGHADLDFKATLYGKTKDDKRELCKDIAAMLSDRGGVIVIGVGDVSFSGSGGCLALVSFSLARLTAPARVRLRTFSGLICAPVRVGNTWASESATSARSVDSSSLSAPRIFTRRLKVGPAGLALTGDR